MTPCHRLTAAGKPCKGTPLPGTDPPTCRAHLGTAGRHTALTDTLADRLVGLLSAGNHLTTALAAVGVPQSTFYDWIDRGNPEGTDERHGVYRTFRERVERARDQGETRNVTTIATAAGKDWRAAAWLLERTRPERWARGKAAELGGERPLEQTGATEGDDDPFSRLQGDPIGDELAERRARGRGR